jgi:hypothetical protein
MKIHRALDQPVVGVEIVEVDQPHLEGKGVDVREDELPDLRKDGR